MGRPFPSKRHFMLLAASGAILCASAAQPDRAEHLAVPLDRRQSGLPLPGTTTTTSATGTTTTTKPLDTTTTTTTPLPDTSTTTTAAITTTTTPINTSLTTTTTTTDSSTTSPVTSSTTTSQTTTPDSTTTTPPNTSNTQPSPTPVVITPPPSTSAFTTTNDAGETVVTEIVVTVAPSTIMASSASPSQSSTANDGDDTGSSHKSTIVGLAVSGSIALLGIVAFFVWKFTRKRFHDEDYNDNEAIKWPDLDQPHGGVVNTEAKAGAFGGASAASVSDFDVSRAPSRVDGYANTSASAAASSMDLHGAYADPYAVPPLPHMNPGQPGAYADDPSFYDPYPGPVPHTLTDSIGHDGEAIPMTQFDARARSPGPGRSMSPGPQAAYAAYPTDGIARTASPAYSAYPADPTGRTTSPGPNAAYGAYPADATRRAGSPGPQAAYGASAANPTGRAMSPGPQVAYAADPTGRTTSPGPQAAYGGGGYGGGNR